jgi:hypothetical protein
MGGRKKILIKELEKELADLIEKSGRSEQDILTDYNDYRALKKRIDDSNSRHHDADIRRMKELKDAYLLGVIIINRQHKIRAARKVATTVAAAAAANAAADAVPIAAAVTSNIANTSVDSSMSTSTSTSINVNKITASFKSTPSPPSSGLSTSLSSLNINPMSDQSSLSASQSTANKITASFDTYSQTNSNDGKLSYLVIILFLFFYPFVFYLILYFHTSSS